MIQYIQKIILVLIISFSILSCVHDEDYNNPPTTKYKDMSVTTDILTLGSQATTTAHEITTDDVVEGYVVSSDNAGNIYKSMYIVSADGKSGLQLSINQSNLYNLYPVGQKVYVKLKGLAIAKQYSMTIVGSMPTGTYAVDQISPTMVTSHIILGKGFINEDLLVRKTNNSGEILKLADLDDSYLNTLIEISDVEFKDAGSTYVRGNANTDNYIKGANSVDLRVSQYANFANYKIPYGNGIVRGIFTKYNTTSQLLIRTVDDVKKFTISGLSIFEETFDKVTDADGNTISSLIRPKINVAKGFDNSSPVTYTDSYGKADIRISGTSFSSPMVWFPANNNASLVINNINTSGYTNMILSFKLNTNIFNSTDIAYVDDLIIKCNGEELSLPHTELNAENNKNMYYTVSIAIPDGTTQIEFFGDAAKNKKGMRIDDIQIEN